MFNKIQLTVFTVLVFVCCVVINFSDPLRFKRFPMSPVGWTAEVYANQPQIGQLFFPVTVLHPTVHPNLRSVIKTQRTTKRVVVYLFTPRIPKSIRPSPFLFRLESNAFPDIGSVGRIEKKTLKKKKKSPEVSEYEALVPQDDVKS